jgi:hypothetical protein
MKAILYENMVNTAATRSRTHFLPTITFESEAITIRQQMKEGMNRKLEHMEITLKY